MNIFKKIASLHRRKGTESEEVQEPEEIKVNEPASISVPAKIQYIETENGIRRADGKPFQDEDLPYLMQRGSEKALTKEKEKKQGFTEHELKLAENFEINHFDGFSEMEFKLFDLEVDVKNEKDLSKKMELLELTMTIYEKLKKFCRSKGKGGTIYFIIEWERNPFMVEMQKELEDTKHKLDINRK